MLEKLQYNIRVDKLRVILLLEANFNVLHKIIFNSRVVINLEARNSILKEIIRGRRL